MKIKITGKKLKKYQDAKIVPEVGNTYNWNTFGQFDPNRFNISPEQTVMGANGVERTTGNFNIGNQKQYQINDGSNTSNNIGYFQTKKTDTRDFYGPGVAATMNAGLSFLNNTLQGIQENKDIAKFTRKYGQTDAGNPAVENTYSRGRNVMNTGEYSPNQMTPIQFAGRPTSEFVGFPKFPYNVYAQEGLNVTEEVLGLPTMYSNPNMRISDNIPEMDNRYFEQNKLDYSKNFAAPVKNYKITSGYGSRISSTKGASAEHNGVDLSVPLNSEVYSPMDGVIENIYTNDQGGKQIIVKHLDGSKSGFAHLNSFSVNVGDTVVKGQPIGLSGNTGNSTGPHLHFTFKNPQGEFINPIDFFNLTGGAKSKYNTGVTNWDHNNPGNIHSGGFAQQYGAVPGRDDNGGKVAIFPTMESGIKAMQDLIFSPSYSNLTVSQARNKWVNGQPDKFTTSSSEIVKAIGGDVPLYKLNDKQKKQLLSEFIKWEDRSVYDKLQKNGFFEQGGEVPNNNNNMKIKIIGTPSTEFADGGKTVGDQMGYGLYRGQAVRDFNAFNKEDEDNYDENVRSTVSKVPREKANIEAEEGEKIIAADGLSIMDIKGKKHSQGGVPMDAKPGSYIVSDFITAPKELQKMFGFETSSNKKKDNTWSKVLDGKVKSKDYNKLSQILQEAAAGKEVDKYELAMAKNKLPLYQNFVSKATLGNEITKMAMGKEYEIPDIAMPSLIKYFPDMAEKMGVGQQPVEQGAMAKYGRSIPKYQYSGTVPNSIANGSNDLIGIAKIFQDINSRNNKNTMNAYGKGAPFVNNTVDPYTGDKYENRENASRYSKEQWTDKLRKLGYNGSWTNEDVQKWLYTQPESRKVIDALHSKYGMPKRGMFDKILGYRWDEALDAIPVKENPPLGNPPNNPPVGNPPSNNPPYGGPPDFTNDGGEDFGKKPYTQDIINLGNALANQYAYPQIGPYAGRYNPIYMQPAFTSTEGVDQLLKSQGRTAMEDASLYAGSPQSQAARQAQINAQLIPGLIQNRVQNNAQNVQTDMASRQFNTQIANQAAMYDAQGVTSLADANARFAMNRAKEKIAGRTATKNMLNKMITNAGDTYLMNQWYPQEAFNPLTYETYFKKGSGKNITDASSTSDANSFSQNFKAAMDYANSIGATTAKDKNDAISTYLNMAMGKPTRSNTRNSRTSSPSYSDNQEQDLQEQKRGGFVPYYKIGGWY
jgi:murein DD-endopeptidase MepM/ murein hydrolase activator NlpD